MSTPARKITNTGTKKNIGKFASNKNQALIPYESYLERDYLYFLEIDPQVIYYTAQPFKLNYYLDGKSHRYTPDFFVERTNKKQVVEVKPENKARLPKYLTLFNKVAPIITEFGWEFSVVTDKMIRIQPCLHNIKILYKYSRVQYSLQHLIRCKDYLQVFSPVTIKEAEQSLHKDGISKQILFSLIYSGFIEIELILPISDVSKIKITDKMRRYLIDAGV
jgi:TnsA endonuclease N terminal